MPAKMLPSPNGKLFAGSKIGEMYWEWQYLEAYSLCDVLSGLLHMFLSKNVTSLWKRYDKGNGMCDWDFGLRNSGKRCKTHGTVAQLLLFISHCLKVLLICFCCYGKIKSLPTHLSYGPFTLCIFWNGLATDWKKLINRTQYDRFSVRSIRWEKLWRERAINGLSIKILVRIRKFHSKFKLTSSKVSSLSARSTFSLYLEAWQVSQFTILIVDD